jgi:hypothetical protein
MLAAASTAVYGQAISANGGSIQGTISDATGAVIPGATIVIDNSATGYSHTLTTDSAGYYSLGPLQPGPYTISITAPNFVGLKVTTVVRTGTATSGNERLTAGSTGETIEVNAGQLQINTDQVGVSDVITSQQIQSLPVNGRNFLDLAQIEPGVILQSGESFDPTKAGYSAISVDGVSGRTTRILLDGQDITDETVGTTIFNVSQGAVSEFQLNRSTQDVSGDVTSTGQVLVSTNSGTNSFHGEAFYDFQDNRAIFARVLNGVNAPLQRNQYGGSIGGPIIKDKLFFFGNAERIQQAESQPSPVGTLFNGSTPGSVVAIKNPIPSPYRLTYSTARLDYNGPLGGHYFVRANYDVDSDASNFGDGYWLYANRDNTPGLAGGADFTTGRFTHSFRGSYEKFHNLITDATGSGNVYNGIPGVAFYYSTQGLFSGPNYLAPQGTFQSDKQVRYDGTYTFRNHNIRYGYSFNAIQGGGFAAFFGLSPRIKISSATLLANCNGVANAAPCPTDPIHGYSAGTSYVGNGQGFFTENPGFGLIGGGTHDYRSGAYIGDSWKIYPSLTINAGVRWSVDTDRANQDSAAPLCSDVDTSSVTAPCTGSGYLFAQWNPAFTGQVHQPYSNYGPQLGINFSPGSHKTSLRAGYGIFYESDVFNNTTNARNVLIKQGAFFNFANVCGNYKLVFPDGTVQTTITGVAGSTTIQTACNDPIATGGPLIAQLQQRYEANTKANALSANGAYVGETLDPTGAYAPNYKTPYSQQWNAGIQRQLWKGSILSVDYVHNTTLRIGQTVDENHVGAARYLDKVAAQNAISATATSFGCPAGFTSASIDCAIQAGAQISDFAGNGLDSGVEYLGGSTAAYNGLPANMGAAFPGKNPLLGEGGFIEPIGKSRYDAVQILYHLQMANPAPGVVSSNFQASYSASRIVTTSNGGSDQFFSYGSWDNDNPSAFIGRADLDHTNEITFGGFFGFKYGLHMGIIGHFYSAPPGDLTLEASGSGAGDIFTSDVTGDGTTADLAPGTKPGSYMHGVKGQSLANFITSFNATQAGKLTPAGQALVSAGLFTQQELTVAGGVIQPVAQVPTPSALNNPSFRNLDADFSYPIEFNKVREGLVLEPKISFYNALNMSNFTRFSGVLLNQSDAGPTNTNTGYFSGPNTFAALNDNRIVRGSGTFDQGGPRTTEFELDIKF